MKRIKEITFLVLLYSSYCYAQMGWFLVESPFAYNLNNIYFIDHNTGFITAHNSVFPSGFIGGILRTVNGGINWQFTDLNSGIFSVSFVDSNRGFSVGYGRSFGSVFNTSNAGIIWSGTPVNQIQNSVKFINKNTGYITGNTGLILKTTDSGEAWFTLSSGSNYHLGDIWFTDSLIGYITGINTGPPSISAIALKTTNAGINWSSCLVYQNRLFHSIFFVNTNTGFIVGGRTENNSLGIILKTTNAGSTWNVKKDSINRDLKSIFMTNADSGFVVGNKTGYGAGNIVLKTNDGGNNWLDQAVPTDMGLLAVYFINSQTGFITGNSGIILKTTTGGNVLGVINISLATPYKFNLNQNYPNPFNPQTKIKFDIPANVKGQTSNVRLVIYDLLGREVAILVNEELKPGTYEADWDGSNYSSGVYFYKIISNEFTETKKMVLMK